MFNNFLVPSGMMIALYLLASLITIVRIVLSGLIAYREAEGSKLRAVFVGLDYMHGSLLLGCFYVAFFYYSVEYDTGRYSMAELASFSRLNLLMLVVPIITIMTSATRDKWRNHRSAQRVTNEGS